MYFFEHKQHSDSGIDIKLFPMLWYLTGSNRPASRKPPPLKYTRAPSIDTSRYLPRSADNRESLNRNDSNGRSQLRQQSWSEFNNTQGRRDASPRVHFADVVCEVMASSMESISPTIKKYGKYSVKLNEDSESARSKIPLAKESKRVKLEVDNPMRMPTNIPVPSRVLHSDVPGRNAGEVGRTRKVKSEELQREFSEKGRTKSSKAHSYDTVPVRMRPTDSQLGNKQSKAKVTVKVDDTVYDSQTKQRKTPSPRPNSSPTPRPNKLDIPQSPKEGGTRADTETDSSCSLSFLKRLEELCDLELDFLEHTVEKKKTAHPVGYSFISKALSSRDRTEGFRQTRQMGPKRVDSDVQPWRSCENCGGVGRIIDDIPEQDTGMSILIMKLTFAHPDCILFLSF